MEGIINNLESMSSGVSSSVHFQVCCIFMQQIIKPSYITQNCNLSLNSKLFLAFLFSRPVWTFMFGYSSGRTVLCKKNSYETLPSEQIQLCCWTQYRREAQNYIRVEKFTNLLLREIFQRRRWIVNWIQMTPANWWWIDTMHFAVRIVKDRDNSLIKMYFRETMNAI